MFQEYKKYRDLLYDSYSCKYKSFMQMINNSENEQSISMTNVENTQHKCENIDNIYNIVDIDDTKECEENKITSDFLRPILSLIIPPPGRAIKFITG